MCTGLVYLGPGGDSLMGRSTHWKPDPATALRALPYGMKRAGRVDWNGLDLGDGAPVRKRGLGRDESTTLAGEIAANLVTAEPLTFLGIGA
jgi:hypothetical protein